MDDLDQYLDLLYDGLTGLVYSPVKRKGTEKDWDQVWFKYPDERGALKEHIRSNVDGDVYISPAVYAERRATKDGIKTLQTVWVEFDGSEKINFKEAPLPDMIVQTSLSTHLHCYWRIGKTPLASVEDINRRLTYYLQADYSGVDATQLLRPPGTFNHKRQLPVNLVSPPVGNKTHPVGSFDHIPEIAIPVGSVPDLGELPDWHEVLKQHQLPIKLLKMIKTEEPKEPYRSSFLARLSHELAEEGLSHVEIVSLLKHTDSRIGKFHGRDDQLIRLSQLADLSIHKHIAEEEIIVYTPEYILNHVEDLQWIIPGLLHTTGQLVLASAPAVGKTQLCMQLAYSLEKGVRWLGFLAPMKLRVLFMSLEMDVTSLKYILNHQKSEWESIPSFNIIDEPTSWTKYEDIIERTNTQVAIIDSLTELMDESEDNPNNEARRLMKWCRKVRRRYGIAIILIHHNRKATEGNKKPKNLSDLAGSFLFAKDTDTVLQLWEDAKGIELSGVKVRFGRKDTATFLIERNEHLWFRRKDATDESESVQSTATGTGTVKEDSNRLGDSMDRSTFGSVSFRFGGKD